MSSTGTGTTRSAHRGSSEQVAVDIYFLSCGHGDTILLRLPANRWILVDCHLHNRYTRSHFFDFVQSQGIRRLEYIFQTHPDFDHFCGMAEVLDYFTRDGRSLGYWCDGGLDAAQVRNLIWCEQFSENEYAKLHDKLDELWDSGLIQTVCVNEWTKPISPAGYSERIDLFTIAPRASTARAIARADIGRLRQNIRAQLESNALSVVLVLSLVTHDGNCNVLLCADASPEEIKVALQTWQRRAEEHRREKVFDVIKVPHHGSINSHVPDLCKAKREGREDRVAAISAGTRKGLPDREVMRAYLDEEWVVLLTTTRTGTLRSNYLLEMADRSGVSGYTTGPQDIKISWDSKAGLKWEPLSARVDAGSLDLYETRAANT